MASKDLNKVYEGLKFSYYLIIFSNNNTQLNV